MQHRVDITVGELGGEPANADRLLGALHELLPAGEAVIDQNVSSRELTASFEIDSPSILDAVDEATRVLVVAADCSGFAVPHVIAITAREGARDSGLLAV